VTWDGLTNYRDEAIRIYSGPLACEHVAFIIHPQASGATGVMHSHDIAEEVYVLLRGRAQVLVGDETIEMKPLDAVRVAPTFDHTTSNPYDEEALWLVMGAPVGEFIEFDPVAYGPPAG
jgi:mannose-6-phosphate isomerase-like protein (cupin superfamily)